MADSLKGKHIVLGITGGIAAYKSAALVRLLVKRGAEVQVIMTPAGKEFITPVTLSALTGKPVISDFFTANTGEWHSHVDLGIWADLMIIAPATANTLAKMAAGVADNMLLTTYLSAKEHVMAAPAMDLDMWAHPATQRNIRTLENDGVEIIYPADGELASHLTGKGRMESPETILSRIERHFSTAQDLKGKKVVITAGPTYENIDPVRFIGNHSSGKMGFALADTFARRGADVTVVAGPVSITPACADIKRINVKSALEMRDAVMQLLDSSDIMVFCAAVADYRPETSFDTKIKRQDKDVLILKLIKNPDIAAECGKRKKDGQIMVGFALETNDGPKNAAEKMQRKNMDMIVLNSLEDKGAGFGTDTNKVTIFSKVGKRDYPLESKSEIARHIVSEIKALL